MAPLAEWQWLSGRVAECTAREVEWKRLSGVEAEGVKGSKAEGLKAARQLTNPLLG